MTRQQQQFALLAGLVLVCAGIYAGVLRKPAPSAGAAQGEMTQVASAPESAATPEFLAARQAQREEAQSLGWGRDPFIRGAAGQASGFTLSGIIWDAQHPMAIINGLPMTVGGEIDGFQVLEIGQDSVTLSDGSQTYRLRLAP